MAFKLDEAKFLDIVDRAAAAGWPMTGGMSSWGGFHPPLRAYLLAPVRWLTSDATAIPLALGFFSTLNALVVIVVAGRFGWVAATGAAAVVAASPWIIHFGRALWDAPVVLFGTLALVTAILAVSRDDDRWAAAPPPLLALQALTHLTAWLALPLLGYLLLRFPVFRRRLSLAGLVVGVLLLIPSATLILTAPEGLGTILSARASAGGVSLATGLQFASWYISGADLQALLGERYAPQYALSSILAVGPFILGGLVAAGVVACLTGREGREETTRPRGAGVSAPAEILLAWTALPLAATLLLPGPSQLHYFQVWGGGAPFVLAGLGFAALWSRVRLLSARAALLALLLMVPVAQGLAWRGLLSFVAATPDTALGPSLVDWQRLALATRDAATGPVFVWSDGDHPAFHDKPAALRKLVSGEVELVFTRRESAAYVPPDQVYVTTYPRSAPPWGFGPLSASPLASSTAGTVWLAAFPPPPPRIPSAAPFADGLTLQGYDWRTAGEPARPALQLVTFWRVDQPTDRARTADLTLFVHLEDANGRRVAQEDGLDWPSSRWTRGSIIAQRSTLELTGLTDPPRVRIGIYSRKDLQRSLRSDNGEDHVLLGPLGSDD